MLFAYTLIDLSSEEEWFYNGMYLHFISFSQTIENFGKIPKKNAISDLRQSRAAPDANNACENAVGH